ncbi:MAG: hypothetical protein JXB49_07105 [Bacteroidales bacterium]|nr:hypothetical protein [Bacteroidales bacterium]
MNILNQLSSSQGDKTESSNKKVAEKSIKEPKLLKDIASGFDNKDKKLQADCIEVFTMVSENHPDLVVPFADKVILLLSSKETKIRWEAVHTLAFIADKIPDQIFSILPELQELIEKDKSTIVRDYSLDAIANYAKVNKDASENVYEILKKALEIWEEKHAKQVFKGFCNIIDNQPKFSSEINRLVEPYLNAEKKIVITEAKRLLKKLNNPGL